MTAPARLLFRMMSSSAARSSSCVQRLAIQEMPGGLRVAAHGGERLTQLVRQCAGELSERRHAAQVRELAPLRVGVDLIALAIGDVLDDAQDLVAVATDDARLVEAFGILRAHHVFELFGLVRRATRGERPGQHLADRWRQHLGDAPAQEGGRRHVQPRRVTRVIVEKDAVDGRQEHPVGNGAQHGAIARLAGVQRLVCALVLDGDAGDVGGRFDQPQLDLVRRARLGVVHRKGTERLAAAASRSASTSTRAGRTAAPRSR